MDPRFSGAYNNRGIAYNEVGRYDLAIRDFDKAIELRPDYAKAYNNRGSAYDKKGDYDQAIQDYDKAIAFDPKDAHCHSNRGLAHVEKGQLELAVRDFDKAIKLNPSYAKAYNNRGFVHLSKGDYDQAIHDFDTAIELNPSYANAHNRRGLAYKSKGELDRASRDFDKAVELDPSHADARAHKYMNLALLEYQQGKTELAVERYRQALEFRGDWPEILNNLAWILATDEDTQIRDGVEAVRHAEYACQLTDYKVVSMLDTLAVAYAEAGQFDLAVETAEKATVLARSTGQDNLAESIQEHLELFRAGKGYRAR